MDIYLIVGAKRSGIAAAGLLKRTNHAFVLFDSDENLDIDALLSEHEELRAGEVYAGTLPEEVTEKISIVVLSPGVPTDSEFVLAMKKRGKKIWGEVELAYQFGKGRVAGITGTNGKTTTTALTGEIMKTHFSSVFVVGNIGIPYTSVSDQTKDDSVVVAEISSFMLETIDEFAPKVSAILNITPDHLNRHHTMDNYIKAKETITKNQSAGDTCVLNYEDETLREFGKTLKCKVVYFSSRQKLSDGYYYENQAIYRAKNNVSEKLIATDELNILGLHNFENVMAAAAIAEAFGVTMDEICMALRKFQAVEHRIEFVCEKRGVRFYNDSKGTNPDAAIKAIQAMDRKTCLIGGGYDKQSSYDDWILSFQGKVKKLVLIGVTKEKIAKCAEKNGFKDYVFADSLEDAVDICYRNAENGEAVLLSPACASWDMFPNYEERGRIFKEYVRSLPEA